MSIRTTGSVRTIGAVGATSTLLGGASSALLLALAASPAGAASTWTVDTLADGAENATDCTTPVVGSCSLRDALAAAAIGDTVTFSPTLFTGGAGTITLTNGQLVDDGVNITGPGANLLTVDAAAASRVFYVTPAVTGTTISDVTITGGTVGGTDGGAGILVQGANTLTVRDSVITGNTAGSAGGGIYAQNLIVTGSSVTDNYSGYFGGGLIVSDRLTVSGSTISGNSALLQGGGISIFGPNANLAVVDSTVSGNTSQAGAGIAGYSVTGAVSIANSTLTGNVATGQGGAIAVNVPTLDIAMSTITGNSAGGSTPFYSGGGIMLVGAGAEFPTVTLTGTVVAGNTAGVGGTSDIVVGTDISDTGTVTANTSLIGSGVTPNLTLTGAGLLRGDDPRLGALADNGGPTQTMLPLPGSPVLNAGPSTIPVFPGNEFDQRGAGFLRLVGTNAEIGAVEIQTPPEPVVPHFTG